MSYPLEKVWIVPVVVLLTVALFISLPVQAQEGPRQVSVQGEAEMEVEPDIATVRFGIVTTAEMPEAARQRNAEAASGAMKAVRDLGIPARNMQMERLQLRPHHRYDPDTERREQDGFEVERQVVVNLDSLDLLPTLVALVVQKGANRLHHIQYDRSNRSALRNKVLAQAVRNARQKAQLMAEAVGARLESVLQLSENQVDFPRPVMRVEQAARMASKTGEEPTPEAYAGGQITVRAVVQASFGLQ